MNSLWYLYDNGFSEEICSNILSHWNDLEAQKGKVGANTVSTDESVRKSRVNMFPYGSKEQKTFAHLLEDYITIANRECFGFHLNGFSEFQITEYTANNFYNEHMDVAINECESQRKISVTVQLSDTNDYVGGDFMFGTKIINPDSVSLRTKGAILCFPSFVPHRVGNVTSGKRYSLVGWYEGNKWC